MSSVIENLRFSARTFRDDSIAAIIQNDAANYIEDLQRERDELKQKLDNWQALAGCNPDSIISNLRVLAEVEAERESRIDGGVMTEAADFLERYSALINNYDSNKCQEIFPSTNSMLDGLSIIKKDGE